ncbi:hypothetical protein [Cohnella soli]|uniref:Lipoprotein n=1 Tax=Cohnella soli TaxID=425005 RepID=A0ABW0HJF0_9BACL
MKSAIILPLLGVLIAGCTQSHEQNLSEMSSTKPAYPTSPTVSFEISQDSVDSKPYLNKIKQVTYNMAKSYRDNLRISLEDYLNQPSTNVSYSDHYNVSWISDGVGASVVVVFYSEKPNEWKPVFSGAFGRDITAISWRTDAFGAEEPLLSVESYNSAGTRRINHTQLIYLQGSTAQIAFDLDTVTYEAPHMLKNGNEERWKLVQNFVVVSQGMNDNHSIPEIDVSGYEQTDVIHGQTIKSSSKEFISVGYTWDASSHRFIETAEKNPVNSY